MSAEHDDGLFNGYQHGYKAVVLNPLNHHRLLLIPSQNHPDRWDIPGGRRKQHESPRTTVLRELEEETPWLRTSAHDKAWKPEDHLLGVQCFGGPQARVLRRFVVMHALNPQDMPDDCAWLTAREAIPHADQHLGSFLQGRIDSGWDFTNTRQYM